VGGKIQVAQSVTVASPHDGPSSHVISADPVETFYFVVGMLEVIYKPVSARFIDRISGSVLFVLFRNLLGRQLPFELIVPGIIVHGGVIFNVIDHSSTLEHHGFTSLLGQRFSGPAATDPSSYDYGIEGCILIKSTHRLYGC